MHARTSKNWKETKQNQGNKKKFSRKLMDRNVSATRRVREQRGLHRLLEEPDHEVFEVFRALRFRSISFLAGNDEVGALLLDEPLCEFGALR